MLFAARGMNEWWDHSSESQEAAEPRSSAREPRVGCLCDLGASSRAPERKGQCEDALERRGTKKLCGTVGPAGRLPSSLPLLCPQEARDTGERKEQDCAQKQPQEPTATTGVQNQGSSWQSFMKCLLEVEEEEATQRRAPKARALPNRKSPRTLTPVSTSASSLPLTLPQTPASAPTAPPSWARPPAPGPAPAPAGAPVPASAPGTVLPAPAPEAGWRKAALLHQGGERGLSHAKAR